MSNSYALKLGGGPISKLRKITSDNMTIPAGCAGSGDDGGADDGTGRLLEGWGCSSSPDATRLRDRDGDKDAVAASAGSPGGVATPCREEEVAMAMLVVATSAAKPCGAATPCVEAEAAMACVEAPAAEDAEWKACIVSGACGCLHCSTAASAAATTAAPAETAVAMATRVHNHKNNTNNNIW